jgi:hypothetical protein
MPSGKIEIKIGKSFKFEKSKDSLHRDGIDSILKEIMNKIAELLPNDMRGVYR